ncbi:MULTISPECIES: hypothetical protein [Virgibacillus]|uniref:Uncharacterized protein n=1 Tax=Virgibacillus massiliensis TaxID=1462526 RepID=A0A024QH78_9BACI|nr:MULTISPECIES: hypothetical protein [Virgibacillus]EQB34766.1 hypothetical protein M948_20475 [Virgibacillus sp. CM-4]MYL43597.1 hypothetical protein [Virgibacillus massiliensis]CDQ41535.1 hypothetical protein BN990_03908 [Virgibacillus massiliensis]
MERPLNPMEAQYLQDFIKCDDPDGNGVLLDAYVSNNDVIYYYLISPSNTVQGFLLLRQ